MAEQVDITRVEPLLEMTAGWTIRSSRAAAVTLPTSATVTSAVSCLISTSHP